MNIFLIVSFISLLVSVYVMFSVGRVERLVLDYENKFLSLAAELQDDILSSRVAKNDSSVFTLEMLMMYATGDILKHITVPFLVRAIFSQEVEEGRFPAPALDHSQKIYFIKFSGIFKDFLAERHILITVVFVVCGQFATLNSILFRKILFAIQGLADGAGHHPAKA